MRGETAVIMEDEKIEVAEHEGGSLTKRRPSSETLGNMLKKAAHERRHHRYNGGEWSAAADMESHDFGQNGGSEGLIRTNPFYAYYKESTSQSNGMESTETETSAQADVQNTSVTSFRSLSVPQDLGNGMGTTENAARLSERLKTPQTYEPKDELFRPSSLSLGATTCDDDHETETLPKPRQRNGSDDVDALFRSSNKVRDSVNTAQAVAPNPFHQTRTSEADLFSKGKELFHDDTPTTNNGMSYKETFDPFSSSSTNTTDPFPSPLPRNLFSVSSLDDPFGPTPSKQNDHFQDFSCTEGGKDIFGITPSQATTSTPSTKDPSDFKLAMPTSADPLKRTLPKPPPVVPRKPSIKQRDLSRTPQVSKGEILQPTPFSQASSLPSSFSFSPADMDHVQTFKRPPRALPRVRRPNADKPPTPQRPSPTVLPTKLEPEVPEPHAAVPEALKPPPKPVFKPVHPLKPKKPESKPVEPENFVIFEDILFTGEEQCVEDWPEDSPQLDPDFKPSGKFKLRRDSMKAKIESDGGSSEDPDSSFGHVKKKDKKLRMSLLSRRSSKDKYSDTMEGKGNTPPIRKSSKEFGSNGHISTGDDEDNYSLNYKKKSTKTKVNHLFRRASIASYTLGGNDTNGLHHSKYDSDPDKKSSKRKNIITRRQSEGATLDDGDYEEAMKGGHGKRRNSMLKVKFVPKRGFALSLEKPHDEPKGAYGYTPRKSSKDKSFEDFGEQDFTPRPKFQDEDLEEMEGLSLNSTKKKSKLKVHLPRKSKSSQKPNEDLSEEDEMPEKDVRITGEEYDEDPDGIEMLKLKKQFTFKVPKKYKRKSKKGKNRSEAAPEGHLSEAAKAAWEAAQRDGQAVAGSEDEYDKEEEDGDTDSLLEWWYTVEKWDELLSDEEDASIKEEESKSFTVMADKVERGLRLFNKVFTEQAEVLWESIISLHALADDISEFHHKARIAGISGGTTTALGTVTAITGLALAPFTFGASLVVAAVGVGVATAGGITSASAAISDNVNNKNDRKKIEVVLQDYEDRLLEISKILHFVNQGLYRLRGHPFLRSGTQHYSHDWEVRKAVQMISMVDAPVMRATEITDDAVGSLQGLFKGMDKYFVKETRELKKSCRKEIVGEIRQVANVLNNCIVELNKIREELQESTGQV